MMIPPTTPQQWEGPEQNVPPLAAADSTGRDKTSQPAPHHLPRCHIHYKTVTALMTETNPKLELVSKHTHKNEKIRISNA